MQGLAPRASKIEPDGIRHRLRELKPVEDKITAYIAGSFEKFLQGQDQSLYNGLRLGAELTAPCCAVGALTGWPWARSPPQHRP